MIQVDSSEIDEFYPFVTAIVSDYSEEFQEFASIIMHKSRRVMPTDPTEALDLYLYLLQKINEHS